MNRIGGDRKGMDDKGWGHDASEVGCNGSRIQ